MYTIKQNLRLHLELAAKTSYAFNSIKNNLPYNQQTIVNKTEIDLKNVKVVYIIRANKSKSYRSVSFIIKKYIL